MPRVMPRRRAAAGVLAGALAGFLAWAGPTLAVQPTAAGTLGRPATTPAVGTRRAGLRAADATPGVSYALIDTWAKAPWSLRAGHYGKPVDISSAPDGTRYILDAASDAVHVLDAANVPIRVLRMPAGSNAQGGWQVKRMDVGPDGVLCILTSQPRQVNGQIRVRILRLAGDGRLLGAFDIAAPLPNWYVDLAVGPEGRIYVSRRGRQEAFCLFDIPTPTPWPPGGAAFNAIDVYTPAGRLAETLPWPDSCYPAALDVGPDGSVYAVSHCQVPCEGPQPGRPAPTPVPPPSDLAGAGAGAKADAGQKGFAAAGKPSLDRADAAGRADIAGRTGAADRVNAAGRAGAWDRVPPADGALAPTRIRAVEPFEGIVRLGSAPDHAVMARYPFNQAEDIAVGPAGVFVSRHMEVFRAGEPDPLYSGPAGRFSSALLGDTVLTLDAPAGGGLLAAMTHCAFQGLGVFDDPDARPIAPRWLGVTDAPRLEGPVYPVRLAAGADMAVLQGQYLTAREAWGSTEDAYVVLPQARLGQVVQRWPRPAGGPLPVLRPDRQLGTCPGDEGTLWTRDVAAAGEVVYTLDPDVVRARPDDGLPGAAFWPAGLVPPDAHPHLAALSASGGRVAVLDIGTQRVWLLRGVDPARPPADPVLAVSADWPIAQPGDAASGDGLPIDIALGLDRVYLADAARTRVSVRGLDGQALGEWPLPDGPVAIDVGPDGDVFVLGRGRWAFRYNRDGRLLAAWPLPDRAMDATDVAVDALGQVYVAYHHRSLLRDDPNGLTGSRADQLDAAGVWVFAPRSAPAAAPAAPAPGACFAMPDKRAAPSRLPLGSDVTVTLEVSGRCPDEADRTQVVLAVDNSRSMNKNGALARARSAALAVLGALEPGFTRIGLVTFADAAALEVPLGAGFGAVQNRVARLEAAGNTRMGAGIAAAAAELTGPRADPAARRIMLLLTDGAAKDSPEAAAAAARAAGVELAAAVFPNAELRDGDTQRLLGMAGDPRRVLIDPDPIDVAGWVGRLTNAREAHGLFRMLVITDVLPDNMAYVPDSAEPPAELAGSRLTWRLTDVSGDRVLRLRYRVTPRQVGTWPTNVMAAGDYRDALDRAGHLEFPVPVVEVVGAPPRLFLPILHAGDCRPAAPLDVVLVLDASRSMDAPAGDGSGRTKLQAARAAVSDFLGRLRLAGGRGSAAIDRVALVAFAETARRVVPLTEDAAGLRLGLDGVATGQGTRIDRGLQDAADLLLHEARPVALRRVILLTDGRQSGPTGPVLARAADLRAAGVAVHVIGLGADADRSLLEAVASGSAAYSEAPDGEALAAAMRRLGERLVCAGDGVAGGAGTANGLTPSGSRADWSTTTQSTTRSQPMVEATAGR